MLLSPCILFFKNLLSRHVCVVSYPCPVFMSMLDAEKVHMTMIQVEISVPHYYEMWRRLYDNDSNKMSVPHFGHYPTSRRKAKIFHFEATWAKHEKYQQNNTSRLQPELLDYYNLSPMQHNIDTITSLEVKLNKALKRRRLVASKIYMQVG